MSNWRVNGPCKDEHQRGELQPNDGLKPGTGYNDTGKQAT